MTGAVRLDLSHDAQQEGDDRRALDGLDQIPDGALVYIELGARTWLTTDAVRLLHQHRERLKLVVIATSPWMVEKFVVQIRRGSNESEVA